MRGRPVWVSMLAVGVLATLAPLVVDGTGGATADAAVRTTLIIKESEKVASESLKTAVAECPDGTRVLGGGGKLLGGDHKVTMATMSPFHTDAGDGFSVAAVERPGGHSGSWRVFAHAICSRPLDGMEIVTAFNFRPPNISGAKRADAQCPPGKIAVGTGGAVGGADRGAYIKMIWPVKDPNLTIVRVIGQRGTTDVPEDFAVFAWAVCSLERPAGYHHREPTFVYDGGHGGETVGCDRGRAIATGVNLDTRATHGTVFLEEMYTETFAGTARGHQVAGDDRNWEAAISVTCVD